MAWGRRRRKARPAPSDNQVPPDIGSSAADAQSSTAIARRARRIATEATRASRLADPGAPTPEQLTRHTFAEKLIVEAWDKPPVKVTRNLTGRAIDRYRARGLLDQRQHQAAERYRGDYDRGGYERSVISNYEGGGGSASGPNYTGTMAATLAQIDARERLRTARASLPVRLVPAFDALVLHEIEAAQVGNDNGRPGSQASRFAIEWLRICCDMLGDFYRMS